MTNVVTAARPGVTRPAFVLAAAYVALMPFSQPAGPMNIRLVDFVIPVLGAVLLWNRALPGPFRRLTALDWCVAALVLTALPSLLVTPDLRTSVVAWMKHAYVAAAFVVFAAYFAAYGARPLLRILVLVAVGISIVCAIAAIVYVTTGVQSRSIGLSMPLPYIGSVLRVWGGTDSSEMLGNLLTLAWTLGCVFAVESTRRGWWIAGLALILIAMALSTSHAVAGFAAATVVLAWPLAAQPSWRLARAAGVAAAVLLIVGINVVSIMAVREITWTRDHNPRLPPPDYRYGFQTAAGADRVTVAISYNPISYFLIKRVAIEGFREHPLTGVGIGTFQRLMGRAYEAGRVHEPYRAIDPHSTLFGALAETGVAGALAAVALFAAALLTRPHSADVWLVRALHAGVVGIAINSLNADVLHFRFLWIALAALRAL